MIRQLRKTIDSHYLILILGSSLVLRTLYALSRPLFASGPDAQTYIDMAQDFSEKNFFSADIRNLPTYTAGFPFFMSILIRISPTHLVVLTTIAQCLLFTLAAFLYHKLSEALWGIDISRICTLLICFNPAWIAVTGEAMYETLLLSLLIISMYLIMNVPNISQSFSQGRLATGGLFAGFAIVTHPRLLLIFLLIFGFLFHTRIKEWSSRLILLISFSLLPVFFGLRNLIAEGTFSIASSLLPSFTVGHSGISGCSNYECIISKIVSHPLESIRESLRNLAYFWSPHSGSGNRGTWFHNLSPLAELSKRNMTELSSVLGIALSVFIFSLWAFGQIILFKKGRSYVALFLAIAVVFQLTDALVYGDNRHMLIAFIFFLPAETAALKWIYERRRTPNRR